jgi:hypothetical protein
MVSGAIAYRRGWPGLPPGGRGLPPAEYRGNLGMYINGVRIGALSSSAQTIAIPAGYIGYISFKYEDDINTCGDNSGQWSVNASFTSN